LVAKHYTTKAFMLFEISMWESKIFTEVAYIEDQRGAKPVHYGRITSTKAAIKKLVR